MAAVLKRPAAKKEKVRVAKRSGEMPKVSLQEFQQFLQCQLKKEAEHILGKEVPLKDAGAQDLWDEYVAFVKPNLGGTERWVPYHHILGIHEKFLVENVHHASHGWNEHQRFLAIFVFRAHCKCDVFLKAQLPIMQTAGFWKNPRKSFEPGGEMEKSLLKYRRSTGKALMTLCFRMIPRRILKDDVENLVRNITNRTQVLLNVAEAAYPIVKNTKLTAAVKFDQLSELIRAGDGCGDTWAKMLAVCIDMAHPKVGLLASQCDVGTGALAPLRHLLPKGGPAVPVQALEALRKEFNSASGQTAGHFWDLLEVQEKFVRAHFKAAPLIISHSSTGRKQLSAGTLQVQLCEYRQFRHALARSRYGLPHDEALKEPEKEKKANLASLLTRDSKGVVFPLDVKEDGEKKKTLTVPVAQASNRVRVAERVALLCLSKVQGGASETEVKALLGDLLANCKPNVKDVPEDHPAWDACRVTLSHHSPLCSFLYKGEGKKTAKAKTVAFQTTTKASGGPMEAERLARLCYVKIQGGASKDQVLEFRNKMYAQVSPSDVAAQLAAPRAMKRPAAAPSSSPKKART